METSMWKLWTIDHFKFPQLVYRSIIADKYIINFKDMQTVALVHIFYLLKDSILLKADGAFLYFKKKTDCISL